MTPKCLPLFGDVTHHDRVLTTHAQSCDCSRSWSLCQANVPVPRRQSGQLALFILYPLPPGLPTPHSCVYLLIILSKSRSVGHSLFGEMVNKDKSFKHWNLFFIHPAQKQLCVKFRKPAPDPSPPVCFLPPLCRPCSKHGLR